MNTHNVKKGQIFNNYKEICKVLNITPNTGNAKIAQMKELKRYLKWKKEGQKFIILEVYNRPKPKVDLRVNNKGGNNNKYADYIDNLLIQYLLQEKYVNDNDTIKASFSQIFSKNINESKSIIPILTREFADLFKKKIEDVYTEKSLNDIRCLMEYRRIIQNVIQKVLNTSLNRLQKNNIITWQYNYVVNTNTNAIFVGEKDELYYLINKIQDDYCIKNKTKMNYILFNTKMKAKFYKHIKSELLKDNINLISYAKIYHIVLNNNDIVNLLKFEHKQLIREKLKTLLYTTIRKTFEKEVNKNTYLFKKNMWLYRQDIKKLDKLFFIDGEELNLEYNNNDKDWWGD